MTKKAIPDSEESKKRKPTQPKHGTSPASTGVKKKRGGQPGNRNAYRHGFYARNIPTDIAWDPPPDTGYDTLEPEIHAVQVLVNHLSARLDTPDPELKDPDAPLNAIITAFKSLDDARKYHDRLQNNPLETQRLLEDIRIHNEIRYTPPSNLLTVKNLEELRLRLYPSTHRLESLLSPELLENYQAVQAFQNEQELSDESE